MSEIPEDEVIQLLRESLTRDEVPYSLKITFRLSGGAPSKRVFEEIQMVGSDKHEIARSDETRSLPHEEGALELSLAETRELFERIATDPDDYVPRSQAAFLPDAVLGCISVEVEGQTADFFYQVDEEQERGQATATRARGGPDVPSTISTLRSLVAKQLDRTGRSEPGSE